MLGMTTMTNSRFLAAVFSTSLLCACTPDESTPPTGDGDTGNATETTDNATDDGTDDATDDGTDDGTDECIGPDGCFACEPTDSAELTNACTDASCDPFPNTVERLPLLEPDGGLPPLP